MMDQIMYLNIGIDVAKDVHEACILNNKEEQIGKYIRIKNFKSSIEKFRERVESTASELDLIPRPR
jgi:transposase